MKSSFCSEDEKVSTAYAELVTSSKKTFDSLLELQGVCMQRFFFINCIRLASLSVFVSLSPLFTQALFGKNPSVDQQADGKAALTRSESNTSDAEDSDDEWHQISDMQNR